MGNTTKRGRAVAKEIGGKTERKVGKLVGSPRMQARGHARELEGRAEKEAVKARERVAGKVDELKGEAERKVAAPLADTLMRVRGSLLRVRGSARSAKGRLRRKLNEASDAEEESDEQPR